MNSALAGIGLVYYNKSDDDKAFTYFDKIVKKDPKSEEARNVLPYIKKIFESQKKIDEMDAYFASVGNPLNTSELEVSLYEAAREAYYTEKNYDVAMQKFESYIAKYPMVNTLQKLIFALPNVLIVKTCLQKHYHRINLLMRNLVAHTLKQLY